MSPRSSSHGDPLDAGQIERVRSLYVLLGEARAAHAIGIPRATFARALGGLGLRAGTALLIRTRLDEIAKVEVSP